MRKLYTEPKIDVLLFDDIEITTDSGTNANLITTNAATELNSFMFNEKGVKSTATMSIHQITVSGE